MNYLASLVAIFRSRYWPLTLLVPLLVFLPYHGINRVMDQLPPRAAPLPHIFAIMGVLALHGYSFYYTASLIVARGRTYAPFYPRDIPYYWQRAIGFAIWAIFIGAVFVVRMLLKMWQYREPEFLAHGSPIDFDVGQNIEAILWEGWYEGFFPNTWLGWLLAFAMRPFIFHAGCSKDWRQALNVTWYMDFVSRMWFEMLMSVLFVFAFAIAIAIPLAVIGIVVEALRSPEDWYYVADYYVKVWLPWITAPFVPFIWAHLDYQQYQLYLVRGGTPMTIDCEPIAGEEVPAPPSSTMLEGYTPDPWNPYAAPAATEGNPPTDAHGQGTSATNE